MSHGLFDWLLPKLVGKPRRFADLLRFPSTPASYATTKAPGHQNLFGTMLGFPATPDYANARAALEPVPELEREPVRGGGGGRRGGS